MLSIQTYIYVDSHGKVATQPLHNFSQNTFRPFKSSHSNAGPPEKSVPSQILTDQFTLSISTGGQIMTAMTISPGFSDLSTALEDLGTVRLLFWHLLLTLFQSEKADYTHPRGCI